MPPSNLLKSAAGTCRYCGQKAGVLSQSHTDCRRTFDAGFKEMVKLAAEAAKTHRFDEKSLRLSPAKTARRPTATGTPLKHGRQTSADAARETRPVPGAGVEKPAQAPGGGKQKGRVVDGSPLSLRQVRRRTRKSRTKAEWFIERYWIAMKAGREAAIQGQRNCANHPGGRGEFCTAPSSRVKR